MKLVPTAFAIDDVYSITFNQTLVNTFHFTLQLKVEEQRVDPNLRDGDGATPLHFAASRGNNISIQTAVNHSLNTFNCRTFRCGQMASESRRQTVIG